MLLDGAVARGVAVDTDVLFDIVEDSGLSFGEPVHIFNIGKLCKKF